MMWRGKEAAEEETCRMGESTKLREVSQVGVRNLSTWLERGKM